MEIYVVIIYIYIYTWVPTSDFTYINMTYMCQSTYCGGLRTPALPKGCLKAKQNNGMFTTYQPVDFWTINIAIIAIIAIIVITNILTYPQVISHSHHLNWWFRHRWHQVAIRKPRERRRTSGPSIAVCFVSGASWWSKERPASWRRGIFSVWWGKKKGGGYHQKKGGTPIARWMVYNGTCQTNGWELGVPHTTMVKWLY